MSDTRKWVARREPDREDGDRSHTVDDGTGENYHAHGWENDSGVEGYGLTWEQALDIEQCSRLREVYLAFRDELNYISAAKQRYNTVNRNVMTKTVRRFCYAMEVAIQGDPVVYQKDEE